MSASLLIDAENIFHALGGTKAAAAHVSITALMWWRDVHHGEESSCAISEVLGYGKPSDPGVRVFARALGRLRREGGEKVEDTSLLAELDDWSAAVAAHLAAIQDRTLTPAQSTAHRRALGNRIQARIAKGRLASGARTAVVAVGWDSHAAETVMLADVAHLLNEGVPRSAIVLASGDNKIVSLYHRAKEPGLLLAKSGGTPHSDDDSGRASRVPDVLALYRLRALLPEDHPKGAPITQDLLATLRRRDRRPRHTTPPSAPRVLSDPVALLRAVHWAELGTHRPGEAAWDAAWGDEDLRLAASSTLLEEAPGIRVADDELAEAVEGVWEGDPERAIVAYRAFALMALHRLSRDDGASLGAAIRGDASLREEFWRPYVLMQPYLL